MAKNSNVMQIRIQLFIGSIGLSPRENENFTLLTYNRTGMERQAAELRLVTRFFLMGGSCVSGLSV
jgi:hypothetical protein